MYCDSVRVAGVKINALTINDHELYPTAPKKSRSIDGLFFGRATYKALNFTYYMKDAGGIYSVTLKEYDDKPKDVVTIYPAPSFGRILDTKEAQTSLKCNFPDDVIYDRDESHSFDLHQPAQPNDTHRHFKVRKNTAEIFVKTLFRRHEIDGDTEKYSRQFSAAKKFLSDNNLTRAIFFPDTNFVHNDVCDSMQDKKNVMGKEMQYSIGLDVV